jgi:aspartyl-tRNA synthetase
MWKRAVAAPTKFRPTNPRWDLTGSKPNFTVVHFTTRKANESTSRQLRIAVKKGGRFTRQRAYPPCWVYDIALFSSNRYVQPQHPIAQSEVPKERQIQRKHGQRKKGANPLDDANHRMNMFGFSVRAVNF